MPNSDTELPTAIDESMYVPIGKYREVKERADKLEASAISTAINAAAIKLCSAALDIIQSDPHSWSSRPCGNCQTVSSLVGRPFGCGLYRIKNAKK